MPLSIPAERGNSRVPRVLRAARSASHPKRRRNRRTPRRPAVLPLDAGSQSVESVRSSCAGLVLRRSGGSPRRARPSLLRPSSGSPDAAAPWAGRGTGLGGFAPKPPGFIALRARAASFPGTNLRSVRKGCPRPQGGKSQGVWGTGPPAAAATARGPQEIPDALNPLLSSLSFCCALVAPSRQKATFRYEKQPLNLQISTCAPGKSYAEVGIESRLSIGAPLHSAEMLRTCVCLVKEHT